MLIIRLCDLPNNYKHMYYTMLCEELDKVGLESRVADISKQYLHEIFYI